MLRVPWSKNINYGFCKSGHNVYCHHRLGMLVHKKTATAVGLTGVKRYNILHITVLYNMMTIYN